MWVVTAFVVGLVVEKYVGVVGRVVDLVKGWMAK